MPKARQTCTQCSVRRQKCDRNVPCGRCLSRDVAHLCTRAWPTPEASRVHRGPSLLPHGNDTLLDHSIAEPDGEGIRESQTPQRVSPLQRHQLQEATFVSPGVHVDADDRGLESDGLAGRMSPGVNNALEPEVFSFTPSGSMSALVAPASEASSPRLPSGFPNIRETSIALLQLHLPSVEQIWHLVDYHEKYLLWYHGCYHGPTFRAELRDALERHNEILPLDELNLQWTALLFSIMAGSMACASEGMLRSWDFWETKPLLLPGQWYEAALTCLQLAGYTRNHEIFAVHAITTLSMSAHPLGFSEELTVLLGTALKIAQSLGLNHLHRKHGSEIIDESSTHMQRKQILQREIGRRLWSQLCVQDWFSLPSSGSLMNPKDFTTTKPSNRDHVTMAHIDEAFPTYVSYGNYLNDIAKLMAEHHVAMAHSSTPYTRYEQVLIFDKKMRKLAKEIPGYFSVTTLVDTSWPVFIPWARRSLTICFAHKIIMIHRKFISKSFTNPAFQMTRDTCIAAAKTILKEAKQEQEEDVPVIWIDQVSPHGILVHAKLTPAGLLYRGGHSPMSGHHASR
jgi:hypothetical protein